MTELLHGTVIGDHWIRRDGVMTHVTQWDYAANRVLFSDQLWRNGKGKHWAAEDDENAPSDIVRKVTPGTDIGTELRNAEINSRWRTKNGMEALLVRVDNSDSMFPLRFNLYECGLFVQALWYKYSGESTQATPRIGADEFNIVSRAGLAAVTIPPVPILKESPPPTPVSLQEKVSLPEMPGEEDKLKWQHACQMDFFETRCDFLNAYSALRKTMSEEELAIFRDNIIKDLYDPNLGDQPE